MKTIVYNYPYEVDNKNAGIEIRVQKELRDEELFLLKQASLDDYAQNEAWTAIGTNNQMNYSAHGIFRYFGKFPATIATHLINEYTKENDTVIDPMSGSGTTALECLLSNRKCFAFDVNPLSILLAKVKTTHLEANIIDNYFAQIKANYKPLSLDEFDYEPVGLKDIDHWFLKQTQDSIRGLIFEINKIVDAEARDFFMICLAASLRTVSRATSQQGRLFLDVLTAKEDCFETFEKKVKKGIECVSSLPNNNINIHISEYSVENKYDKELFEIADLIIVHPPYFNSYKYSSVNSLELAWLKVNHASVRKNEVHEFFKVGKAENVSKYVDDMTLALSNIGETLKKGGVMAMMIGDTVIKGEYIKATKMVIDAFIKANPDFSVEKMVLRVPKYTEASWTTSQRRETNKVGINLNDFIVIFRKGNDE